MKNYIDQNKLTASDKKSFDFFGSPVSVSADGNTAIVGARGNDSYRGSVYIFTRSGSTWTQQTKLLASDRAAGDHFGWSVSISSDGNTAIVGACHTDSPNTDQGSAYIFTRSGSTWTQQAKLTASDGAANDWFGFSVSISSDGSTAIVGARLDDDASGSAYIFTRSRYGWYEWAKLTASDGASFDYFGHSVSISADGETAIVGAYGYDNFRGAVYIFTRSGSSWTQKSKLMTSDGAASCKFGHSVSISGYGHTVIVGAHTDDSPNVNQGSAYVFTLSGSTWFQQAKLLASDGAASDFFAKAVSISADGQTAIMGAYGDDDWVGSAYIFTRSGSSWIQKNKLLAGDGEAGDNFGHSVSISSDGSTVVVGAYADESTRGSVYIFTRSGCSLNE